MSSLKRKQNEFGSSAQLPEQKRQLVDQTEQNDDVKEPISSSTTSIHNSSNTTTTTTNNNHEVGICQRITGKTNPRKGKKYTNEEDVNILEELLYPYKVTDFLNDCFRKHALHIQWNQNHRHRHQPNSNHSNHSNNGSISKRFPNIPTLQSIIDHPNIHELLNVTSSESIFVWLQKQQPQQQPAEDENESSLTDQQQQYCKKGTRPLIHSIEISDPDTALKLHEINGHALYFRASPIIEQLLVSSVLHSTGLGCGQYDDPTNRTSKVTTLGRGEVEIFIGGSNHNNNTNTKQDQNTNGITTGWHYDFQENFTIQISGIKRWTLHHGLVKHPLRGCTPHYDIISSSSSILSDTISTMESQTLASQLSNQNLQSPTSMINNNNTSSSTDTPRIEIVDMYPGDVLYFPAGMWHTVETIESGISMNISLMASNYATVTCQAIQHLLLQNDEWRQCIQHCCSSSSGNNPNGSSSDSAVEHLQKLLQSLPKLLENAIQNNGFNAHAILPPVLYDHSSTTIANNTNNENDDEELEYVEDDDDDDDDDVNKVTIVNVCEFVLPPLTTTIIGTNIYDWWNKWPMKTHTIYKNPLAILLHVERNIQNCYTNFQPFQSDDFYFPTTKKLDHNNTANNIVDGMGSSIYILNVNFAGNESHESVVRTHLRMNDNVIEDIQKYVEHKRTLDDNSSLEVWYSSENTRQHVNCLVYHGYLVWDRR